MRFRDRPLHGTGIDRDIYVERPALLQSVEAPLRSGRNVLLLGDSGSGKTTILRSVAASLGEDQRPVAWVNAAIADDAAAFLAVVDDALDGSGSGGREGNAPAAALSLLTAVRGLHRPRPATIVVDNLMDAAIGFDVFGRLRDELWELGHTWIVAARPRDSGPLRTPPADAFWGAVVEIPPLDQQETDTFIRLGLENGELDKLKVNRPIAGAFPRALIRDVAATLGADADGQVRNLVALQLQADTLGRSESIAMAELINFGRPVSAHDPEFLERLGWSRPYAQRVLSHLESADLARSVPERSEDRAGRPRKLYMPAS